MRRIGARSLHEIVRNHEITQEIVDAFVREVMDEVMAGHMSTGVARLMIGVQRPRAPHLRWPGDEP